MRNTQSIPVRVPAQARIPYIPFTEAIRLCRNCGGEFYPDDIPARLQDVGQYGTCADCRDEAAADMLAWIGGAA